VGSLSGATAAGVLRCGHPAVFLPSDLGCRRRAGAGGGRQHQLLSTPRSTADMLVCWRCCSTCIHFMFDMQTQQAWIETDYTLLQRSKLPGLSPAVIFAAAAGPKRAAATFQSPWEAAAGRQRERPHAAHCCLR
jgi:hypothetical protein